MRYHVGILILAMAASAAWAQLPILDNTRTKLKTATEKNLPENALKNANTTATPAAKPASAATSTKAAPKSSNKTTAKVEKKNAPKPAAHKEAAKPETAKTPAAPVTAAAPAAERKDDSGADLPASMADVAKKLAAVRRDPFVSPVVTRIENTSCTTGKRCLTPGQMSLKGVVRSENGMIAVVVNSMNKAYFLRENDPIFNGYVLRITGDSVVFRENFQDNLGHPRTREVVKKISTPAV